MYTSCRIQFFLMQNYNYLDTDFYFSTLYTQPCFLCLISFRFFHIYMIWFYSRKSSSQEFSENEWIMYVNAFKDTTIILTRSCPAVSQIKNLWSSFPQGTVLVMKEALEVAIKSSTFRLKFCIVLTDNLWSTWSWTHEVHTQFQSIYFLVIKSGYIYTWISVSGKCILYCDGLQK